MTDEPDKQPETEAEETAEAKPKRRRTRAKTKPAAADQAAAKATPSEEEAPAEEPKPARTRARAKKKDDEPKAEETPKAEEPKPAKPAQPGPARKRGADAPTIAPPVVRAQAKYVRSSARKARLVCEHIRGKDVDEARAILRYTPRAVARDWSKLLESAVANAEHNHELVGEDLRIASVHADEGPTLKRFRPRAMGRASRIRKRTAHLTIKLTPKEN
jgi:ribosomal protein L22